MRVKKAVTLEEHQKNYADIEGQLDLFTGEIHIEFEREPLGLQEILNNVMTYIYTHGGDAQIYQGCAELGYSDIPVIVMNWNKFEKLSDWLEHRFNHELAVEWEDEWTSCSHCGKAVRCAPDSYSWTPSYVWVSEYEVLCHECAGDQADDVIEYYTGQTYRAVPEWFYGILEDHGFVCYSPDEYCKRFETGLHPGQNDSPGKVAREIERELPDHDYIFKIDGKGQFDISWSVYLRRKEQ